MEPKDFDVATDALPEEVKKLFRNCRLIGRRFRLAHVFFGRETIEVATFRAASAPSQGEEPLADADPEDGEAAELDSPAEIEAALEETLGDDDTDDDDADEDVGEEDEGDDASSGTPTRAAGDAIGRGQTGVAESERGSSRTQPDEAARRREPATARSDSTSHSGERTPRAGEVESRDAASRRDSRRRDRFDDDSDTERLLDARGRILRDNIYGTIDED